MEDGAIKGKNKVKMGNGKQFLRSVGRIGPEDCRCCGILLVCQQN